MHSLEDLEVAGRTVVVRSDLNVPMTTTQDGPVISDDGRIRAALPTLLSLIKRGARVVVISHLGRPKGAVVPELTLAPVATRLGQLLDQEVAFATDTVGPSAHAVVAALEPGQIALLENLRFHSEETSKDDAVRSAFAGQLAQHGDAFVGDGFGVSHRRHASVYDIALLLPRAAGYLVLREVEVLDKLSVEPARPYTVVLGGSKVSDKLDVIDALLHCADRLIIGGGMAYTFLAAQGHGVGTSLLESEQIHTCQAYLERAQARGVEICLPTDIVVADHFAADAPHQVVPTDSIPDGWMGLDIGPESAERFAQGVSESATVFWNGPIGVFEFPAFAGGTLAVARALAGLKGLSVVGGGDSAAAVRALGFTDDQFSHISTGGGASLEYLEGKVLPGIAVLEEGS
ncbi:MAG TPA: phosphoglycerate kinase [Actinobacteria bacterium]|nr:phosphoglycerate kinase [Actinomycetota bacterium]